MSARAVKILMSGNVQGCGLRPALAKLAARQFWSGTARNTTVGVEVNLCGQLPADTLLAELITGSLPASCELDRLTISDLQDFSVQGFCIESSHLSGQMGILIPRDLAVCAECLAETRDPENRRYRYPFTSCAVCGPRYSITNSMPFDRERTTLNKFIMCGECRREYENPADRRFHAQTICCHNCGPQIWLSRSLGQRLAACDEAMDRAGEALRRGEIVAVRGVGGYQLLVDATNQESVLRLRHRKRRLAKPFAVMCASMDEARSLAEISSLEESRLSSASNPIVILRKRPGTILSPLINPGLNEIGLFLPSTVLHHRLVELAERPLICTSGNRDGDPLAWDVDDSQHRLSGVADWFLHHDREISRPIDDSVVRVIAGKVVNIRCGRGLAPLPLSLKVRITGIALGGHQKATIAISSNRVSWMSPHIGDLETVAAQDEWLRRIDFAAEDCGIDSASDFNEASNGNGWEYVAYDPHPEYFPTQFAKTFDIDQTPVWHHHAHIVAGMLEHGWLDRTVLGVAFDGTGLGPDGTVWGGEFLIADATAFQRVGHLRSFSLPPGEAAAGDLRTLAISFLSQLNELSPHSIAEALKITRGDIRLRLHGLRTRWSSRGTSCGRLFDAMACLILGQHVSSYEGHAAMLLESSCDHSERDEYIFSWNGKTPGELDWRPVFRQVLRDQKANVPAGTIAMKFHRGLAIAIIAFARRWPDLDVVLGGGVFQNRVLTELIHEQWPRHTSSLGLPGSIPPNDGGLSAGQLACLAMSMQRKGETECALEYPDASANGLIEIR